MGFFTTYKSFSRWQKLTIWTGVFFVLYTLFGFFIFPRIFQKVSVDNLSLALKRKVTIEKVTFNPYSLFLTVNGLNINEISSDDRFLSFNHAHVNLQAESILKLGPVVRELRIDGLFINAIRQKDGTYNFSDLVPAGSEASPREESDKGKDQVKPLGFSISNIVLSGGRIMVNDLPKNKVHTFNNMQLAIPFISNLDTHLDIFVTPHFSVNIDGSPIIMEGQSKPFTASRTTRMELNLQGIELKRYFAYLPVETNIDLKSGTADLSCSIEFSQPEDARSLPGLFLAGKFDLTGFAITDQDAGPVLEIGKMSISLDRSEVLKGNIDIKEVIISSPKIDLSFNASHHLNIYGLIPEGETDGEKDNRPENPESALPFRVTCGRIDIDNTLVTLKDADRTRDVFALQRFGAQNLDLDTETRMVTVGKVVVGDGNLNVFRLGNNDINLVSVAPPRVPEAGPEAVTDESLAWNSKVGNIAVEGFSIKAEDLISMKKGHISLNGITLNATGFSTIPREKTDSTLSFLVNQEGRVELSGQTVINPLSTDMSLSADRIRLAWSQAFIAEYLNLIVSGGTLSTAGRLQLAIPEKMPLKASYAGDMDISDFITVDSRDTEELIKFKHLAVKGIVFDTQPLSARVANLTVTEPVSNVAVSSDGVLNFTEIVKKSGTEETIPDDVEDEGASKEAPVPIQVGQVVIKNGQVVFNDRSVTPHFKTRLTGVDVKLTGLSSEETIQSDLDVRAVVNNHTPVSIKGKINPLKTDFFCDMMVACSDMDLGYLSPYAGKYAGYNIQKGKLSLELKYLVDQRKLDSKNDLFLDQFEFGEKIDSKDAVKAPVRLAVSLLKDPMGRISLNLPVKGHLDDPEFSVAGIVIKMIMNLLVKAATAPFSLLGAMFGGGDDLNIIAFDPGISDVTPQAAQKVETLIKALSQRPGLSLEITGYVDTLKDRSALEQIKLDQLLKAEKLKVLASQGDSEISAETIQLSDDEFDFYLKAVFDQTEEGKAIAEQMKNHTETKASAPETAEAPDAADTEAAAQNGPQDISRDQMIQVIRKGIQILDDDLKHLASERALTVKGAILADGSIDPKRIFTVEAQTLEPQAQAQNVGPGIVVMTLK